MKNIGYLSGIDPDFLTKMVCMGYKTTPLGNGEDKHGKDISLIDISDKIDIIIGYFHKFTPMPEDSKSFKEHLMPAIVEKIPMLIVVPQDVQKQAKELINEVTDTQYIKIVDPNNLFKETKNILQ